MNYRNQFFASIDTRTLYLFIHKLPMMGEVDAEFVKAVKQTVRERNKKRNDCNNISFFNLRESDREFRRITLPADITTKTEAEDYYYKEYYIPCKQVIYDCSGRTHTNFHGVYKMPYGWVAYDTIYLDD